MSYHKLDPARTAMVDIDDTIILWDIDKYKHNKEDLRWVGEDNSFPALPHLKNIDLIKKVKMQGYGIVFWSAAGVDWVEHVIKRLGLEELPDVIMSKPEFAVDDLLDAKKIIKSVIWIEPETGEFKRNA